MKQYDFAPCFKMVKAGLPYYFGKKRVPKTICSIVISKMLEKGTWDNILISLIKIITMKQFINLIKPPIYGGHFMIKNLELFNWRKLIMPVLLVLSFSSLSLNDINAQSPFAVQISISHVCGDKQLGSVEFQLTGDPNSYTYFWEHGATELSLTGLDVGIYTLVVTNDAGCKEEYEVEILDLNACYHEVEIISAPKDKCWAWIQISVFNSSGDPLDESSLNIEWSDGHSSTLSRLFYRGLPFEEACVKITPITQEPIPTDKSCCIIKDCFEFDPIKDCRRRVITKGPIIVNEFTKKGENQFLELLVVGQGDCGEASDIRGFHIDDNNGNLVPANGLVSEFSIGNIGIDLGFLSFRQIENWEKVPNGSLILIYPRKADLGKDFPEDDPTDENGDGVYVLSAENDEFLRGKSSLWNAIEMETPYEGAFVVPSWDLINISSQADGMQVRYPDGELSHGLSFGESVFSGENEFPLWITDASLTDCNCRVIGEDFLDKEQIKCDTPNSEEVTPGKANSTENELIITYLKDCEGEETDSKNTPFNMEYSDNGNSLTVYPNPFETEIMIDYQTEMAGSIRLSIHALDGSLIFKDSWECAEGKHSYLLNPNKNLPAGVLILNFVFPDGEQKDVKITRIR